MSSNAGRDVGGNRRSRSVVFRQPEGLRYYSPGQRPGLTIPIKGTPERATWKARSRAFPTDPRYLKALYYLMISQTSCLRYWGSGAWTDYGRELCRRLIDILTHDF